MTTEEAIEILEATPLMRMERTSDEPCSMLGEAMGMAIEALRKQIAKIATTTDALDEMKNHVIDSICSLSAVSEENSAATEETTANMEELNAVITQAADSTKAVEERAKALKEYVSVFKV